MTAVCLCSHAAHDGPCRRSCGCRMTRYPLRDARRLHPVRAFGYLRRYPVNGWTRAVPIGLGIHPRKTS